ncbi:hypothetical protein ACIRPX_19600 [Streptomyces sp. NPDC101225]|uniref:hypothetical protein n=1 Tax=Streptomyces sp. NPDC101225 TaxID=3366135 RepID=UPI00380554BF
MQLSINRDTRAQRPTANQGLLHTPRGLSSPVQVVNVTPSTGESGAGIRPVVLIRIPSHTGLRNSSPFPSAHWVNARRISVIKAVVDAVADPVIAA